MSGTGTLTLSAANSYAGGTLLTAGILNVGNNAALGNGAVGLAGGNVQAGLAAINLSNPITLVAETGVTGMNNLTFSGAITNTNTVAAGLEIRGVGGTTTLSGPLYLSEDPAGSRFLRFLTNGATGAFSNLVVSGVIADTNGAYTAANGHAVSFFPNGIGSSILVNNANTYGANNGGTAAVTNIGGNNTGLVVMGSATAFGTSTINFNQGKLATDGSNYTIANNVTFQGGPSSFTGSGNLTVNGSLTNNSNNIRFSNFGTGILTFAGPISGSALVLGGPGDIVLSGAASGVSRLTIKGPGTVTLSGSSTRTADLFVDGGALILDYSTQDNSKLADGVAFGFNGGNAVLIGGSHVEVVGSTTLFSGNGSASNITRASGTSTLQLNLIGRGANSTTLNLGENNLALVDNLNAVDGIIGGWFTVGRADWAVNSANAVDSPVIALTTYQAGGETLWTGTQNALLTGSTTLTAGRTVNTLKVATGGAGQSLNLGGLNLLADTGGLLVTGADDYTIANGTLHNGSGFEKILFQNATGVLTISATVAGTGRFTKSGLGTVVLAAANTMTGQVSINEGVLEISSNANLGAEATGAQLNLAGAGTLRANTTGGSFGLFNGVAGTNNRLLQLGQIGGTIEVTGTNSFTIAGLVQGGGVNNAGLSKTGPGTLVLTNANTYDGPTRILGGTLAVSTLANINVASGIGDAGTGQNAPQYLEINGATLQWIGTTAQTTNRNFTIGAGGATLDASGSVPGNALTFTGSPVFSVPNAAQTFTLTGSGGDNSAPNVFSGILTDNGSAATSLVKSGAGAWSLTNPNNKFSGSLSINSGTLSVNGAGTLGTGTTLAVNSTGTLSVNAGGVVGRNVSVNAGGNLMGTGTVSGSVTVAGTGLINLIDTNPGTLSLGGGLTLNSGSILGYDLGAVGSSDLLALTAGAFSASGTTTVNLNSIFGFGAGTYDLISGASGISAANFAVGSGTLGSFTYSLGVLGSTLQLRVAGSVPATAYWRGDLSGLWNVGGANTNWATSSVGTTDTAAIPGFSSNVIFSATGAGNLATTLGQDFFVQSLTFNNTPGGAVSISGANKLTVGTGITVESGAGAVSIATSQLSLLTSQTWTNDSANDLTVSASVTGAVALTKSGTGTLVLSGANTYTGGTIIDPGTIRAGSSSALGSGNVTMNGGTLDLNGQSLTTGLLSGGTGTVTNGVAAPATLTLSNTGTHSYSGVIQDGVGTLALVKGSAGTQILVGAHTYTGGTTISGGILQLGNVALAQDGSIVGNVVNNGVFAIANSILPVTLNGNITGTGSLVKTGGGTLALNGNNSYSAGSTISTGLVVLGSGTALGSGNVTVANGAGIDLNGQTIANNFSSIAGAGFTGEGALFNNSIPAAITGAITGAIGGGVNPGSFTVGGTGDIALERATSPNAFLITKINTGTLTLGGSLDNAFAQITVEAGTVIFAKASTGGIHAVGGANSLTLNNGTVRLAGTGGDQIFNNNITTINGGTFDLNGTNETLGRLFGSGGVGVITNDLASSSSTLTVGGNNGTGSDFNGTIEDGAGGTGVVGITKIGTGTWSIGGTLDYTGATTVNGGTLTVTSSITGTSALTIANGATVILGGPGLAPAPFEDGGELFAGAGGAAAVPEPGSIGLLLAGALGFLGRRPHRLSRRVENTGRSGLDS